MQDFIFNFIQSTTGLDPTTFALVLGVLVAVCNLLGKLIPDSATGPLGILRKVCKVLGLYITNRLTPGVSAGDVTRSIAATLPDHVIQEASGSLAGAVKTGIEAGSIAASIVDVAHGRTPGRSYIPGESPEPGSTVPNEFRTDGPFGAGKKKGK